MVILRGNLPARDHFISDDLSAERKLTNEIKANLKILPLNFGEEAFHNCGSRFFGGW
jgi:hypothetical protein